MSIDENLKKALRKRITDKNLVPTETLNDLLTADGIEKAGQLSREIKEQFAINSLDIIDYTTYLPQRIPLTSTFEKDVLDPIMTVSVPTGMYRLTMRKLLRFSMAQLQRQAKLMLIDTHELDEIGIAMLIMRHADEKTLLIPELSHALMVKEIARIFGVKLRILARGTAHPSSTIQIILRPETMIQSLYLTQEDLLNECENQGIPVKRKDNKNRLAVRLVVWWTENPYTVREPFTENFAKFLMTIRSE